MSFTLLLQVGLQLFAFSLVGWAAGDLLLRAARLTPRAGDTDEGFTQIWIGGVERALSVVVGTLAFSVVAMLLHIASRGYVFEAAWPVPLLALLVLIVWWPRRSRVALPPMAVMWPWLLLAGVLLAVFVLPGLIAGSSVRGGDPPWHLGWTQQLLGGEPRPSGPAPGFGRNAYPWGWHSLLAVLTRLVPGSDPLTGHESLHVVVAVAIPLTAAALARRFERAAGLPAALATGLIGGFGWIKALGPAFISSPSAALYGADLVVASPNSVYELFPPALPREMGLVLLGTAATFMLLARVTGETRGLWLAGFVAGLAGLLSMPLFVTLLLWMGALALAADRGQRGRIALRLLAPALGVVGLWALPVLIDYFRFGGFLNVTPRLGREWPLWTSLASWGILLPAAVVGTFAAAKRGVAAGRVLLALGGVSIGLLVAALARGAFDWTLGGNATLLHQGRVWPPAHLIAGALAGIGILFIGRYLLQRWGRRPTYAVAAVAVVLGAASPMLASVDLGRTMAASEAGYIYNRSEVRAADSFVQRAAEHLNPDDVVFVETSDRLAFLLFEFSGARLARYDDLKLASNDLRIRYADLAHSWDAQMADGGFEPDYLVLDLDAAQDLDPIVEGDFGGHTWGLFPTTGSSSD